MGKIFNVNADCHPDLHYMVDLNDRLEKIRKMIDAGQYFTINRARQYGKTTTLTALAKYLREDHMVVSLDFQLFSTGTFKTENTFSLAFAKAFIQSWKENKIPSSDEIYKILDLLNAAVLEKRENFPDKNQAWTKIGFLEAVSLLLKEKNTLFESLVNKLTDYPKLREMLYSLLFDGKIIPYTPLNPSIAIGEMFGFIKQDGDVIVIANRIFETLLYNLFLSEELLDNKCHQTEGLMTCVRISALP